MQIPALTAARRSSTGTKVNRKQRANGRLPGVLYGKGQDNLNLLLDTKQVLKLLHESAHVVELDVEGERQYALLRALQRDHLGDDVQHVDLVRVELSDKVHLKVPLTFLGTPKGATHGGLLEVLNGEVEIKCPASRIPRLIEVEVTQLEVDQSVHFRELPLPEGAELLVNPDAIVVKCAQARRALASETTAEPGAPAAAAAPAAAGAAKAAPAAPAAPAAKGAGKK
jgi:large subunit ribosomal protein L25